MWSLLAKFSDESANTKQKYVLPTAATHHSAKAVVAGPAVSAAAVAGVAAAVVGPAFAAPLPGSGLDLAERPCFDPAEKQRPCSCCWSSCGPP